MCVEYSSCIGLLSFSAAILILPISPPPLQELQKEKNVVVVQLDQSSRRLSQLEEEKKSTDQSLKRTQGLLDDLKGELDSGRGHLGS